MKEVLVIIGTRPEAIKLAPVVLAMRRTNSHLAAHLLLTGQHPRLADEVLEVFGLAADERIDALAGASDLCVMTARLVESLGGAIQAHAPAAVMVQGDTLSAYAAALAAALRRVPLAHVEAGLRTGVMTDPFPEELSRRQIAPLAEWNFAPTREAQMNLLREGVAADKIERVGNTVVDALRLVRERLGAVAKPPGNPDAGEWTLLVTAHRRENWGKPLLRICEAVRRLTALHSELRVVFSVHPNPAVRAAVYSELASVRGVCIVDAPRYDLWVRRLLDCDAILTDSGGLQEEGAVLGKPVLVLRACTERPEVLRCGAAMMVGARVQEVVESVRKLMLDRELYQRMAVPREVFGDGHAAERIVARLAADLRERRLAPGESHDLSHRNLGDNTAKLRSTVSPATRDYIGTLHV